jgi:hypothetical protein
MAVALSLVGFFLYLDAPYTPNAVVVCVIVYNAAFGFSWVRHCLETVRDGWLADRLTSFPRRCCARAS